MLADACALPRARRGDAAPPDARPDTTVDEYLERCALKTGKLFEAACLLGSAAATAGSARFGLALGIAFQIADDILDCTGETLETGKIAGTDLREGTPTLPLLLAAREDGVVRAPSPAARSTGRWSASPRRARSSARGRWRSTTPTRPAGLDGDVPARGARGLDRRDLTERADPG